MNKVFTSYKTEEEAKRVMDYINDQFVMFTDYPLELVEDDSGWYHQKFQLIMSNYCFNYKNTIAQARTASQDFRRGYAVAKNEK